MGAASIKASGASPQTSAPKLRAPQPLFVERMDWSRAATHVPEWLDLVERALEPNPFLHPAFALPLMQHLMPKKRFDLIAVWAVSESRLLGLFPVAAPRARWGGLARGFEHKQICIGTPLLDRTHAVGAFDALVAWLGEQRPRAAGLLLTDIPTGSAFKREVVQAEGVQHSTTVLERRDRAVLRTHRGDLASDSNVLSLASAKTRKERKRQMRRLAEKGARSYSSSRSAPDVARACEAFLALESQGWKGRRGSALLADPARATFARTMMRGMAATGLCRIDALETEGRAIAMGVVLTSGDTDYFWKTAFDQEYASLSPGVQFTLALTDAQLGSAEIAVTDSCAVPDHPMINRLWPDRMELCDLVVGTGSSDRPELAAALVLEQMRRRTKRKAKALRSWLRRVRPAAARSGTRH